MAKLISLQSQSLDGVKKLNIGDPFESADGTARFLVKIGRARYADESEDPERKPSKKPKPYNRRDMRAAS